MKFYTFEIVVAKEPQDEGYAAYSPTLPGCFSSAKTVEEARRNTREAIQQHVQSLLSHGQPIPQNDLLVHVEELTPGCRRVEPRRRPAGPPTSPSAPSAACRSAAG